MLQTLFMIAHMLPISRRFVVELRGGECRGEYERLIKGAGLPIQRDIRSESWGQWHFITADPNGVLIDVITNIPPSPENADQYKEPVQFTGQT
jgi:hypothetical protein